MESSESNEGTMKYSRIIKFFHQVSKEFVSESVTKDRIILLDGGLGEELLNHGVPYDANIWSARAITESKYHAVVQNVHNLFLEAGAQCITTNSYGIVPGVGFTDHLDVEVHARTAGHLARVALDRYSAKAGRFLLGSLGPLVESYRPDRILSRKEGISYYTTLIRALQPYVDAIIAETLSTTEEAMQVMDALASDQKHLHPPLLLSFTVASNGHLRSQEEVPQALSNILDYWETHTPNIPLLALLFNCSEPESITKTLDSIRRNEALPKRLRSYQILLGAYANRLTPILGDDPSTSSSGIPQPLQTDMSPILGDAPSTSSSCIPQPLRTDLTPSQYFHDFIQPWIEEYNVQMIGGCCGVSPQHIAFISKQIDK